MNERSGEQEQLTRYLANECSEKEAAELEARLLIDASLREQLHFLREVWTYAEARADEWDVDGNWALLRRQLHRVAQQGNAHAYPHDRERVPTSARRHVLRAAATIALIITSGLLSLRIFAPGGSSGFLAPREIVSERADRIELALNDGTRIVLGPESRIRFPTGLNRSIRQVDLEGEAYFDVAAEQEVPFLVRADSAVVRVVGTQFVVRAYPQDDGVRVAVTEGSVGVRTIAAQRLAAPEQVLVEGQLGQLTAAGRFVVSRMPDAGDPLSRMQGRLVFRRAPLNQVLEELERWFDVEFELRSPTAASRRLTASFSEGQPLESIIDAIGISLDLRHQRNGRSITLYTED